MKLEIENNTTVLIGDSTLDNYVHVPRGQSVVDQLRNMLGAKHPLIDLSNDGFTTKDVLQGAPRNKALLFHGSDRHTREVFHPLKELAKITQVKHCVVSVGGNDVREKLAQLLNIPANQKQAMLDEVSKGIFDNYMQILQHLKERNIKPIIMLQYIPDIANDQYKIYQLMKSLTAEQTMEAAVEYMHSLMQKVYAPILRYAEEHGLAVIDLASSLNYRDSSLYVSQIEPSTKGGNVIARLINHVVQHHDHQGPSRLYATFGTPEILSVTTKAETWRPHFQKPSSAEESLEMFASLYDQTLIAENNRFFGIGKHLSRQKSLTEMPTKLEDIITHARDNGPRSKALLQNIGWLDNECEPTPLVINLLGKL